MSSGAADRSTRPFPSSSIPGRARRRHGLARRWGLIALAVLAAVVLLVVMTSRGPLPSVRNADRTAPAPLPPDPDPGGFEPGVATRVASARAAVLAAPDSAAAWGRLGMVFDVHNLVEEAVVCYGLAETLDAGDFRWPYMTALCLPDAAPDDLAEVLRRAQALRPDYAPVNIRLGEALVRAGRHADAERFFHLVPEDDANRSHALLGLGRVALAEGDLASARAWLEQAASARPRHRAVHATLARVHRGLGDRERADDAARRAADLQGKTPILDPARTEVMGEGGTAELLGRKGNRLRRERRYEEAITTLREAVAARPDLATARLDLGLALIATGRADEGLAELREAVRLAPEFEPARRALEWAERERKGSDGTER